MYIQIEGFDGKIKLSKLLRKVKQGQRFTITLQGVPVADLIPSKSAVSHDPRMAIERMLNIKKVRGVSDKMIKVWITEGRL